MVSEPTYRETLGALITIRGLIDRELTRVQRSAPAELTPSVQLQLQNLVKAEKFTTWMVMVAKTERKENKMKTEHEDRVQAEMKQLKESIDELYDAIEELKGGIIADARILDGYLKEFTVGEEINSFQELLDHARQWHDECVDEGRREVEE